MKRLLLIGLFVSPAWAVDKDGTIESFDKSVKAFCLPSAPLKDGESVKDIMTGKCKPVFKFGPLALERCPGKPKPKDSGKPIEKIRTENSEGEPASGEKEVVAPPTDEVARPAAEEVSPILHTAPGAGGSDRVVGDTAMPARPIGCGADTGAALARRMNDGYLIPDSVYEVWIKEGPSGESWKFARENESGARCMKILSDGYGDIRGELITDFDQGGKWVRSRVIGSQLGGRRANSKNQIYELMDIPGREWWIKLACQEQRDQASKPFVAYVKPNPRAGRMPVGFQLEGDPTRPETLALYELDEPDTAQAVVDQLCDQDVGCRREPPMQPAVTVANPRTASR